MLANRKLIISYTIVIVLAMLFAGEARAQIVPPKDNSTPILLANINYDSSYLYDYVDIDNWYSNKRKNADKKQEQELDSDGDGVPDSADLCPDIPGSKKANGCPDEDGDGVPDFEDDCPKVAGLPEFKGCPDTDGDGVPDHKDKCPTVAGPKSNQGCPLEGAKPAVTANVAVDKTVDTAGNGAVAQLRVIEPRKDIFEEDPVSFQPGRSNEYYIELARSLEIEAEIQKQAEMQSAAAMAEVGSKPAEPVNQIKDTDNDGVPDDIDRCPTVVGPKSNYGCPFDVNHKYWKVSKRDIILSGEETRLIEDVLKNTSFAFGRNILDKESHTYLTQLAELLAKKYSWTVILHCHTAEGDNTYRNQQLSVNRGEAIRSFLMSKGVDYSRVQVKGHGDTITLPYVPSSRIELEITR